MVLPFLYGDFLPAFLGLTPEFPYNNSLDQQGVLTHTYGSLVRSNSLRLPLNVNIKYTLT